MLRCQSADVTLRQLSRHPVPVSACASLKTFNGIVITWKGTPNALNLILSASNGFNLRTRVRGRAARVQGSMLAPSAAQPPTTVPAPLPPCPQLEFANPAIPNVGGTYMRTLRLVLPGAGQNDLIVLSLDNTKPSGTPAWVTFPSLTGKPLSAGTSPLLGGGSVTYRAANVATKKGGRLIIRSSEQDGWCSSGSRQRACRLVWQAGWQLSHTACSLNHTLLSSPQAALPTWCLSSHSTSRTTGLAGTWT